MSVALRHVRHRFAQAVHLLNKSASDGEIMLENGGNRQNIVAAWTYVQTKTLLSSASATYLPKPSENPDLKIQGSLPRYPPSGWTPPSKIKLKQEEILASNHILEREGALADVSSWFTFIQENSNNQDSDRESETPPRTTSSNTPSKFNVRISKHKRRRNKRVRKSVSTVDESSFYDVSRSPVEASRLDPSTSRSDPQATTSRTVYASGGLGKMRLLRQVTSLTAKRSTKSADNPRRSTRLSGVPTPSPITKEDSSSKLREKRSISPVEPKFNTNKRPKLSSSPDKGSNLLVDPHVPGLPWRHLTSTMRERAVGYLRRNIIHRQSVACQRCIQQTPARERIDEDCITMFDAQGGSIACFRCGYRQLTCSFANGALIPDTPVEIENPDSSPSSSSEPLPNSPTPSSSETVQPTAESSESVVRDVAAELASKLTVATETTPSDSTVSRTVAMKDSEKPDSANSVAAGSPLLVLNFDLVTNPTFLFPQWQTPRTGQGQGSESQKQIAEHEPVELEAQVEKTDSLDQEDEESHTIRTPNFDHDKEIVPAAGANQGGSLASVLRENPVVTLSPQRTSLRTYSRNDRTTMSASLNSGDDSGLIDDHPYTLRPAFSPEPEGPDIENEDGGNENEDEGKGKGGDEDEDEDNNNDNDNDNDNANKAGSSKHGKLRSYSQRQLPRPHGNENIHESVHHFRSLLHTHQSIIQMRQHIFSSLHANDSALRNSRQSLLNATTQLEQYPFPWDIPTKPPFDGLNQLADDLVCAWSDGFDEKKAFESIRKYDRAKMEVDRHAVDPVEEELDSYYYPNVAKVWSSEGAGSTTG